MNENTAEPRVSMLKLRELFTIYQEIFGRLAPIETKLSLQLDELRRLLDAEQLENLKTHLNNLNNTQTKLVNEIRDLNVAYTKLRNAVK